MSVREVLIELGGLSTRADLILRTSRAAVDRAVLHGEVVVGARGRYALSEVDDAARVAHEMSGVLCLTSAALHHGWEVKQTPELPDVLLPPPQSEP